MNHALEINGLRKVYRDFVLKDVTFSVPEGYIMGLIGPNGAGKTTIIKLIMNLIRKDGGEIRVFGMDHQKQEAEVKSRIGFVYDVPSFYSDARLSVIEHSIRPFYPRWDHDLFLSLAGEFELPLKKKFKKLSQGMKTRFALALALCHDADLVLMDEPTTGLDPVFRRDLLEKLSGILQDSQKSILFSTHVTSDLEKTADYITFLQNGSIVFSSSRHEILEGWGIVKGGQELLQADGWVSVKGMRSGEFGVEILTSDVKGVKSRLPSSAVIERATLEEIMVFMKEGERNAH